MASRRKNSFWLLILAALILIIAMPMMSGTSWHAVFSGWIEDYSEAAEKAAKLDDDDDNDEREQSSSQPLTVILDEDAVDYAGVNTLEVQQTTYFPETSAYASVVNLGELIQWRSKLNQLAATVTLAHVNEQSSLQELNRLKKLAKGTVASKNVTHAQATWQEAAANLKLARLQQKDAETELKQSWGDVISKWVINDESKEFDRLVSREDSLLLLALPLEETLPADVNIIRVARLGNQASTRKAYYVSPAFNAGIVSQGETYYFRISTGKLRTGMRLDAWIPQNDSSLEGVFIPEDAVVWYLGQPWTYVQQDEATYVRRPLASGLTVPDGIFMQKEIEAGENIVISGSQMLLSEEFRWQIMDEDDD